MATLRANPLLLETPAQTHQCFAQSKNVARLTLPAFDLFLSVFSILPPATLPTRIQQPKVHFWVFHRCADAYSVPFRPHSYMSLQSSGRILFLPSMYRTYMVIGSDARNPAVGSALLIRPALPIRAWCAVRKRLVLPVAPPKLLHKAFGKYIALRAERDLHVQRPAPVGRR